MKRYLVFGFVFFVLLVLDQVLKYLVSVYLPEDRSVVVIPGILWLTYVKNTGVAFGLAKGFSFYLSLFGLVGMALIFFLQADVILKHNYGLYGASILSAGAIGNLIDRLRFGYVIDYLDLGFWHVFNFADVCITVGIVLILLIFFKELQNKYTKV